MDVELFNKYIIFDFEKGKAYWKKRPFYRVRVGDEVGNPKENHYLRFTLKGRDYYLHRVMFFMFHNTDIKGEIDHKNGNRQDNRITNLRDILKSENLKNCSLHKKNKSGQSGVDFNRGAWRSRIAVNGKNIHLGRWQCKYLAIAVRKAAEMQYGFNEGHGKKRDKFNKV